MNPPVRKQLGDYLRSDRSEPVPHRCKCGPFAIECRRTIHSVPTFAFRITARRAGARLQRRHGIRPTLIEWLASADLIVHEATTMIHTGVHTPYEKLAALPESLRSKMRLTHYPDDFDVDSSVIEPLRQGRIYEV